MEPGTFVRMRSDPNRTGVYTGRFVDRADARLYRIAFADGTRGFYPEPELMVIADDDPSAGPYGRVADLRRNLTQIRLSGQLADLVYSMDTTNTQFYPHQFKPVLRFLDSPSNGLLIADEVGLGKTIEAGLIWTELRSRYDARRLLVLCPAILRDKWRDELRNRFGIDAQIMGPRELLSDLRNERHTLLEGRGIICTMQGLRPPDGWDSAAYTGRNAAAAQLARLLSERAGAEPLIDLLVIDEAAYLRNPSTQTYQLGKLLREASEHVVLLSATPISLHSGNLFVLLNLLDPDSFHSEHVFPDVLKANAPLIKARAAALNQTATPQEIVALLHEAKSHPLLATSQQLQELLNTPPTTEDLTDKGYRTGLADRLERINLLNNVLSRTRKREVQEWIVVRQPRFQFVDMSPDEAFFYQLVTESVRDYAIERDIHEGFLLASPQRQVSSCMAAAAESWRARTAWDESQIDEDLGDSDSCDAGELIQHIAATVLPQINIAALRAQDSKYEKVRDVLGDFFKQHADAKVVLFSYFRATLFYLQERLGVDGIPTRLLMGGMEGDKQELIGGFRDAPHERVLLSSEVAAEGVDLQFCWVLINYDLPWNPMKVEQRIGRIDRLGQESPTIQIWNLGHRDSIDERIVLRLHNRLGIFEQALGGLEAILGDEIQRLTSDLLTQRLTKAQEEQRITATEMAITANRQMTEQLEEQASSLIAHGGYILEQVRAAKDFSRRITARDLAGFIRDHLSRYYQGSEVRQTDADGRLFAMRLSPAAASGLGEYIRRKRLRGASDLVTGSLVKCEIDTKVESWGRQRVERINQFHPLVRFISDDLKTRDDPFYRRIAMQIPRHAFDKVGVGAYAFAIDRWISKGVRGVQERLAYRACPIGAAGPPLSPDASEQLTLRCAAEGSDWLEASNALDSAMSQASIERCQELLYNDYCSHERISRGENDDRVRFQLASARRQFERYLGVLQQTLDNHRVHGRHALVAATQGRIAKLDERFRIREEELRQKAQLNIHYDEVCVGVLLVS